MFKLLKYWSLKIDGISTRIGSLSSWFVLCMILIGAWNVVGRYVGRIIGTNLSSNTLLELQWQLFAAVVFLGAACTLKQNEHVRVDVFYKDLNPRQKGLANLLGTLVFLVPFSITVIYVSWRSVWNACAIWEVSPNPGGLPLCPPKALMILGFLLLLAQGCSEAIKSWEIIRAGLPTSEDKHHG